MIGCWADVGGECMTLNIRGTRALVAGLLATAAPAYAKPLVSIWTLEPLDSLETREVELGKVFLEQRLLPYRLAQLRGEALLPNGKTLADRTYLFAVFQKDGSSAFCTIKDQSFGSVAKAMLIPALDKRPCLIDADKDGRFEATFGVFDKYGSALTPSGNLSSAKPLRTPIAYELVQPRNFPVSRKFSYSLSRGQDRAKARISVQYNNGSGYAVWDNYSEYTMPGKPTALNLRTEIVSISGNRAMIKMSVDASLYLVGESGGTFVAASLPSFVE